MEFLGFGAGLLLGMVFHHFMKESSNDALCKEVSEHCDRLERLKLLNIDSEIDGLQAEWERSGYLDDKRMKLLGELKMRKYLKNAGRL